MPSLIIKKSLVLGIIFMFVISSTLTLSGCSGGDAGKNAAVVDNNNSGNTGDNNGTLEDLSDFEKTVKDYLGSQSEANIKALINECGFGYEDANGNQANPDALFGAALTTYGVKAAAAAKAKTISINDILNKISLMAYNYGDTYTVPVAAILGGLNRAISDAYQQSFSKDTSLLYYLGMDPRSYNISAQPRTLTSSSQLNFMQAISLAIIISEIADVDLSNSGDYISKLRGSTSLRAPSIDRKRPWLHKLISLVSPREALASVSNNSHPSSELARLAIIDLIGTGGAFMLAAGGLALLSLPASVAVGVPILLLAGAGYFTLAGVTADAYADAMEVAASEADASSDSMRISLLTPSANITVAETALEVQFSVTGSSGSVDRAWVMNAATGASLTVHLSGDGTYKKKMPLTLGENAIWVVATGNSGKLVESEQRVVTLNGTVGRMRVTLTWTGGAGTDVDLHVTDPKGEECYWNHANAARDGLQTKLGGQLDFDDRNGEGPENFTIDYPIAGNYKVEVNYYQGAGVPINATVTVTLNEGSENESATTYGPQVLTAQDKGARSNDRAWWTVISLPVTGNIKLLPQIADTAVAHSYMKNSITWTATNQYTTQGYNVYGRQSHFWQLEGAVSNGLAPRTYTAGMKLNQDLVTTASFDHELAAEYNTFYEYYVLPVNVENVETQKDESTQVVTWFNPDSTKREYLYSVLTLSTDVTGPYYVPTTRFPVEMSGEWKIDGGSAPGPSVMISHDQQTWATLGGFDRGTSYAADIYRYFDLEQYKGKYSYLKLSNGNGSFDPAATAMRRWIMDDEADSLLNRPPVARTSWGQVYIVALTLFNRMRHDDPTLFHPWFPSQMHNLQR